ncbi:MAG TPA: alginate export family protein [Sphingomicrobium sp.]|nr:alginate export family protein [Sphingomicrobium sp.]
MRIGQAAFVAIVSAFPAPALAQELKPIADARLRYEHVDQDGLAADANALTFRLRAGAEARWRHWSLLAEAEGTAALSERYDSGVNGKSQFPIVADPENIELNRLQLQYRGLPKTIATLGRQRINIDDQRFVGSSGWRQNEQTFDAVRLEFGDAEGLKADLTYSWSVRTIWGIDGRDARQKAIGGNNVFATVSHPTPVGALSGFAFLVDQDEADVQGFRLSSQTYGIRLAGSRSLSTKAKVNYTLSYARQSDWHRNPDDYQANYWLADLGIDLGPASVGVGHERLGADEGLPYTSFQTPLATLHKFQGWADKFLTTPPNGVRDSFASAGHGWKNAAGLDAINASLVYHRFRSDRLGLHYGDEWDAMVSAKKGRWTATAKIASYNADEFATDTRKFWLQLEWAY